MNIVRMSAFTFAVSIFSSVFAGSMGEICKHGNVLTPCEEHGFLVGGQALYLKPTSNIYEIPYQLYSNGKAVEYGAQNSWNWGFQLEGAYRFSTGNDFNVNWYRFHNTFKTINSPGNLTWKYSSGTNIDLNINQSIASSNPEWDQVNIELAQRFNYADNKHLRFHAGAQYSRISNNSVWDVIETISVRNVTTPQYNLLNSQSTFNGFGPRVGIDAFYISPWFISTYAKFAISMLAGTTKFNYLGHNIIGMSGSQSRVIPGLDAKLGLNYDYQFAQGVLSADIGWLWVNYINVLNYSFSTDNSPGTPSSFEVQGLYFGLKYRT